MSNIPVYVYILFIALVYMGVKRCYPRVIRLRRLFVAPMLFTWLSVRGMVTLFDVQALDVSLWVMGGVVGAVLGYMHVKNRKIKADHKQQLIGLPGDWSMLCLILAIFFFEFFVHYSIEANLALASTVMFKSLSLVLLGVIAGLSVGRVLKYYLKYRSTVSERLIFMD